MAFNDKAWQAICICMWHAMTTAWLAIYSFATVSDDFQGALRSTDAITLGWQPDSFRHDGKQQ